MASVMPFTGTNYRRADPWRFVGLASSFPNVELDGSSLVEKQPCSSSGGSGGAAPGCRVFRIPRPVGPASKDGVEEDIEEIEPEDAGSPAHLRSMKDQVLVFRYKGKFHAVDNRCPHSSYPLSNGAPFDIEDFGVVLSRGLTCPKHGWSFDLHTGLADRGAYRLGVWELELRPVGNGDAAEEEEEEGKAEREVWVRRKQRLG